MTTTCQSCGAEIVWAVTMGGKPTPCDAKTVKVQVWTGRIVETVHGPSQQVEVKTAYVSHFASCPQRDKWRKSHGTA